MFSSHLKLLHWHGHIHGHPYCWNFFIITSYTGAIICQEGKMLGKKDQMWDTSNCFNQNEYTGTCIWT